MYTKFKCANCGTGIRKISLYASDLCFDCKKIVSSIAEEILDKSRVGI